MLGRPRRRPPARALALKPVSVPPPSLPPEPINQPNTQLLRPRHRTSRVSTTSNCLTAQAPAPSWPISATTRWRSGSAETAVQHSRWGNPAPVVLPLEDFAGIARKEQAQVNDVDAWLHPVRECAMSAVVTLCLNETYLEILVGCGGCRPGPPRDLVQLRVRQGQWGNCLTTAVSRSGRARVCLVASNCRVRPGQRRRASFSCPAHTGGAQLAE
jgi:hypothetical protein